MILQGEARERALAWRNGKNTGASSKTICGFFLGEKPDPAYPHDAGDLGRCFGLLDKVPEIWPHLHELEALGGLEGQAYAALVPNFQQWRAWLNQNDSGEGLEQVHSAMKAILEPIEAASGRVVRLGPNAKMTMPAGIAQMMEKTMENVEKQYFIPAARLVISEQKATTSFLQRHLKLGYTAAAHLIQCLENSGIISPANHTGHRKVLVSDIEHVERAHKVADQVMEVAAKTGVSPDKVLQTAKREIGMGHNSTPHNVGGVSGERLTMLIERIERLEEEKGGIAEDIRDVYAEAKSAGYETKIMRQLVKLRKMDHQKRQEQEELLDLYKSAIGLE